MAEFTQPHNLAYPVASDRIKDPNATAKLAADIKAVAVSANDAITAIDAKATSAVSTANNALAVSSGASSDAGNAVDRVTALESAAGFGPSTPTDGTMANFIANPESLTAGALSAAIAESVDAANQAKRAGQSLHADYKGTQREGAPGMVVGALRKYNDKSDSAISLGSSSLTAATGTVTTVSPHGLAEGSRVRFGEGGTLPSTVTPGTNYFVRTAPSPTELTLKRDNGANLSWSTDGNAPLYEWPLVTEFAASRDTGAINPAFRFTNAKPIQSSATAPYRDWVKADPASLTYAPGTLTGPSIMLETVTNATSIDLLLVHNIGYPTRIWVDGRLALTLTPAQFTAAGVSASTGLARLGITFDRAALRKIGVEVQQGNVAGIEYLDGNPPLFPTDQRGARTMIQGDSYAEGGSAGLSGMPFPVWVQRLLGWADVWRSGSGSTGYVTDGTRKSLLSRYQNDIIAQTPDRLILAHGANDATATTAAVKAAAETIIDAVRSALPATEIIVVGPFVPKSPAAAIHIAHDAALQEVAKSRGLQFISPIQEEWITGTGKEGAPAGNGNADAYIGSDGVHPTAAGHEYLGWRLAGHLA